MPSYRLLKHRQYDRSVDRLPLAIQHKAVWSQVLLGTRGRTPNVKTTTGYNARWRRTPVQGYHYYLWWIPLSESNLADTPDPDPGRTILVHSIRHHDETDDPIDLRSLDEFEEVQITALDPRYDEQRAVGERMLRDNVSLATIKGLPGSGKTISLFYLVRDLAGQVGMQNILYVTYTSRLKRAAREFLAAQGTGFEQSVRVRTLNETLGDLLGAPVPQLDPFADLGDFLRFLELQQPSSLGEWRRYPETLYTELRAYLFGRSLPQGLPAARRAQRPRIFHGGNGQCAGLCERPRHRAPPGRTGSAHRRSAGRPLLCRPAAGGTRPHAAGRRQQAAGVAAQPRRPDRRRGAGPHAAADAGARPTGAHAAAAPAGHTAGGSRRRRRIADRPAQRL